ncbi:MAG: calcium/proton exchanger [Planctomycetota bacterium]
MPNIFKPSLDWLLVFVPVSAGLHYLAPHNDVFIFLASCLAIIPLAGWMGHATEKLADKTGEGIGGLLNATFGNAAELIIALMALRAGQYEIVKASLTGSIIGNVLLVNGAAFLAGGLKHTHQRFNGTAARSQATMLTLAAIGLIAPMGYHYLAGAAPQEVLLRREKDLSLEISLVLLGIYALSLVFSLHTHKNLFTGASTETPETSHKKLPEEPDEHEKPWSVSRALITLFVATGLIAWISEFLVDSVTNAAQSMGMTSLFVGVIVVAVIGNAAEHSSAITMAMKNRMDLALSIANGSSLQIALFVAPVLVLASYVVGKNGPMDLVFSPVEAVAIFLSVQIAEQIASDGESNWLEGAQLLSVYAIAGIVFYFLP